MMENSRRVLCIIIGIALLLATLTGPAAADTMTTLDCQNLPGSDYKSIAVTTRDECSAACLAETPCKAATFVHAVNQPASCWMKNSVPAAQPAQCDMQLVMHSFIKNVQKEITYVGFNCNPVSGPAPLAVECTAVVEGTATVSSYVWDFGGDGVHTTYIKDIGHTFQNHGSYNVVLTVNSAEAASKQADYMIIVTAPQPTTGYLSVITSPSGATLYVDGASQGTTPKSGITLTPGSHAVLISKTGYSDYSQSVTIEAGKTNELTITLTSNQQPDTTGTMTIASTPSGASVFLDNTAKGTTPLTLKELAPKTYSLVLKKTGYTDYKASVKVEAGETTTINAMLGTTVTQTATVTATTPSQPGTGSLSVVTNPAGAQVYIDGGMAGVSPTTIPGLSAGTHNLMLKMNGYQDLMTTVTVTAGQTAEYNTALSKVKTPGFESIFAVAALCVVLFLGRKRA